MCPCHPRNLELILPFPLKSNLMCTGISVVVDIVLLLTLAVLLVQKPPVPHPTN